MAVDFRGIQEMPVLQLETSWNQCNFSANSSLIVTVQNLRGNAWQGSLNFFAKSVAGAEFGTAMAKLPWVPKQAILKQYSPKPIKL